MTLLDSPEVHLPRYDHQDSISLGFRLDARTGVGVYIADLLKENPMFEGDGFKVFCTPADSALSIPGIATDVRVREEVWGDTPTESEETARQYIEQPGTFVFTYIDTREAENPKVAGSLTVLDISGGDGTTSESIQYYRKKHGLGPEEAIPKEMQAGEYDKLWDIMSVMVLNEYQSIETAKDGVFVSATLYHALYLEACRVAGIRHDEIIVEPPINLGWITTMTRPETKNTKGRIGIPFRPITTAGRQDEVPEDADWYSFHSLKVHEIYPAVIDKINDYEEAGKVVDVQRAFIARVALLGTFRLSGSSEAA